jgi:hypothetical protein
MRRKPSSTPLVSHAGDGILKTDSPAAREKLDAAQSVAHDYAFGVFAAVSAEVVAEICADAGASPERISAVVGWWRGHDFRSPSGM